MLMGSALVAYGRFDRRVRCGNNCVRYHGGLMITLKSPLYGCTLIE
jgi:hypothetical protein